MTSNADAGSPDEPPVQRPDDERRDYEDDKDDADELPVRLDLAIETPEPDALDQERAEPLDDEAF
jgi:hypothetical protein